MLDFIRNTIRSIKNLILRICRSGKSKSKDTSYKKEVSKSDLEEISSVQFLQRLGVTAIYIPWKEEWANDLTLVSKDTSLPGPCYTHTPDGEGCLILPIGYGNIIFYSGNYGHQESVRYTAPGNIDELLRAWIFKGHTVSTEQLKDFVGESCRDLRLKKTTQLFLQVSYYINQCNREKVKLNPRTRLREEVIHPDIPVNRPLSYPWTREDNILRDSVANGLKLAHGVNTTN